ncbi:MAG: NTP transferase domain-containing protein [Lachnospiraceae bacterium]|nr:NTP transferase domain-containing protein [Lachnospiraceae bacterium]
MKNLKIFMVEEENSIKEVMKKIAVNARGLVFVCKGGRLLATVTDGDIRRYILAGGDIEGEVSQAANYSPVFVYPEERERAKDIMIRRSITALPVVDHDHRITDILFLRYPDAEDAEEAKVGVNVPVIIMAGGKGQRLKPFTDILPKPLIPLGEKTITERIIMRFQKYGCNRFYMIVNYKKNFIKAYFADNEMNYNIQFVEEEKFLGTAGGLKLVQGEVSGDFFVSNCDILIEADYQAILEEHVRKECIITLVCAHKKYQMPYGTVEGDAEGYVCRMQEKPILSYNINTGLYVVNERFLERIPQDTFVDMTELVGDCIRKKEKVGIYLIEEEQWLDTGQMEELEKTYTALKLNG